MARDTFEVYYFQNGRWSVHASFEANERELALAEAQKIEKTLGFPSRLVRETFYSETNTTEEVVSWQSAKAKQLGDADRMFGDAPKPAAPKKKPPPPVAAAQPRRKEEILPSTTPASSKPAPKRKKRAKKPSSGVATKLAVVVAMSLAISAAIVVVVSGALWILTEQLHAMPAEDHTGEVAMLFLVSYVISAVYQLFKQFNIRFGWSRKRKSDGPSASDMIRRMRQTQGPAAAALPVQADGETNLADVDIDDLRAQVEEADTAEQTESRGDDDFGAEVHAAQPIAPAEIPPPQVVEPPKIEKPIEKPVEKPPEKRPEKPPEAQADAEARHGLMSFVQTTINAAAQEQTELNAFSRFGLNLYIAGACASVGQSRKLARAAQLTILRDGLQAAGNSRERVETFCAELPSYGKNPRYAGMIQAGGGAMTRQLSGQPVNSNELKGLLAEWSKPEKRSSVPSAFTFMFTDIVNSTALTSQLGNAGAQRVVRAHNTAVRGAIQAQQGREVKHTGDGIMATFPTPAAAALGAIQALKEIAAHSAANPAVAFAIRIGVNVGEAVEEDNDFFGAAVQMTARICSVCTPSNVWVSRAVVDACKGQRLSFIPRGAFQMKGIQQARPLYEVAYTDAHRNEVANL